MKINRGYKVELDPNNVQRTHLLKHAGAARWAYNWGLRKRIDSYWKTGKSPNSIELSREFTKLKKASKEDGGVPWMYEVSSFSPLEALRNLDEAYESFFRRCKRNAKKKGLPHFKSRHQGIGRFTLKRPIRITSKGTYIQLPRLGKIRLKERGYLPQDGVKIFSATVSERAGRWFVSLKVEVEVSDPNPSSDDIVGVDVGIKRLAVTSNGEVFENPKALTGAFKKLRQLSKTVARRKKGSNNRKKAARRLARHHYRISCIRKDAIHKATTTIAKSAGTIVIETLNVAGMLKNRKLSRALADASLSEFHRQLKYKAKWRGVTLVKADRFFPSSKKCSRCGSVKESLNLGERTYHCDSCNLKMDRDLNAAINLKTLAVSSTVSACRQGSAGLNRKIQAKLPFGQEPNIAITP